MHVFKRLKCKTTLNKLNAKPPKRISYVLVSMGSIENLVSCLN